MQIVIENLPHDVSEEGIREALKPFAPMARITLIKEGNLPTAVINMDMTHAGAVGLAVRIDGHLYNGQRLRAWVPRWQG